MDTQYVMITAARNEESYIEKTLRSVVNQTIVPNKWVIVSDGSTDKTDEIVFSYAKKYPFIELVRKTQEFRRNFGSQVRAFNIGFNVIKDLSYDFIGNFDADISFDPTYVENILNKFYENKKLGIAGGFIYEESKGEFRSREFNTKRSVANAIQIFRRDCYESTGGYIPLKYGGHDWVIEVMARMKGWHVESFQEFKVYHHRHTGTGEGSLFRGLFRQGAMDYSLGSHPLFEFFKFLSRIRGKPYLVGSLCRLVGFMNAYLKKEKREVPYEFIQFLRREQIGRIMSILP